MIFKKLKELINKKSEPKLNLYQLKEKYETYLKDAYSIIEKLPNGVSQYIIGSGFRSSGSYIRLDKRISKSDLNLVKKSVSHIDNVSIETGEIPRMN